MKKIYYVPIVILVLLIVTNPSQKAFKEYLGSTSYNDLRRTNNYFVFSVYEDDAGFRYVAALENFFCLNSVKEATQAQQDTITKADSAKYTDSAKMADSLNQYVPTK